MFHKEIIIDTEFDKDEIKRQIAIQKTHKIPPGYKDSSKEDNGIGDVLIWRTILEIGKKYKKNLIFVSGEEKADWCYRSEGQVLYPRYELVDEYRRFSEGKLFHMIQFSTLLNLYGADENVVDEIRKQELEKLTHIFDLFDLDEVIGLAKMRISIEKRLSIIAGFYNIEKKQTLRELLLLLSDIVTFPIDIVKRIDRVIQISSKAIHSNEIISKEDKKLIKHDSFLIIDFLDKVIEKLKNDKGDTVNTLISEDF